LLWQPGVPPTTLLARAAPRIILRDAAAAARLAPSTHNTQPWRFHLRRDETLEILADESRHLPAIDPLRRQLITSCGCAVMNARVAVRAAGYVDEVTPFPDLARPELIATIRLGLARAPDADDHALRAAVDRRHTNRRPFADRPVPAATADALARAARAGRARMFRLDPHQKAMLGWLVADADRQQFDDPRYRAELARWLVPRTSLRRDGIPFSEKEYGSGRPFAKWWAMRASDLGERFAEVERTRIRDAPLVIALATEADEPLDWLDAGQALEAVLLRATALGLSASFLNQVLEHAELAVAIDQLVDTDLNVQMLLRLGWAPPPETPAPRRELYELLTED
jgi:nitroreductase